MVDKIGSMRSCPTGRDEPPQVILKQLWPIIRGVDEMGSRSFPCLPTILYPCSLRLCYVRSKISRYMSSTSHLQPVRHVEDAKASYGSLRPPLSKTRASLLTQDTLQFSKDRLSTAGSQTNKVNKLYMSMIMQTLICSRRHFPFSQRAHVLTG